MDVHVNYNINYKIASITLFDIDNQSNDTGVLEKTSKIN